MSLFYLRIKATNVVTTAISKQKKKDYLSLFFRLKKPSKRLGKVATSTESPGTAIQ